MALIARHLLDTDVAIELLRKRDADLLARVREAQVVALSSVSLYELRYGADRSADPAKNHASVDELMATIAKVEDFGSRAAAEAGSIRADLAAQGRAIGPYDLQIAGHARSLGLVLVTRNVKEFKRVTGLEVERW